MPWRVASRGLLMPLRVASAGDFSFEVDVVLGDVAAIRKAAAAKRPPLP